MKHSILLICLFTFISLSSFSQGEYSIILNTNYTTPSSEISFNQNYLGTFALDLGVQKTVGDDLYAGIKLNSNRFHLNQRINNNPRTSVIILTPSVFLSYNILGEGKWDFRTAIEGGISFFNFTNPDLGGSFYKENGFSFRPSIYLLREINENLSIGVNSSYQIIFERFGIEDFGSALDEAPTTQFTNFGLTFEINL